jgi:integrase
MLTLRKRGRFWHIRGALRVGRQARSVKEHSTGCDRKEDAEAYQSRLEGELRHELLYGVGKRAERMTVADAGLRYVNRPGGVKSYDLWRLDQLNEVMGEYSIARAAEGWSEFKRIRCTELAPATVERFRAVLQAVLNYAGSEDQFEAPKIRRTERLQKKRIRFLSKVRQELLLSSYAPHVRPIAVALCFQGLRIGEALRLDWAHVNWRANSLFILPETKNGEARTASMHRRLRKELHRLYVGRGRPKEGRIFLNRVGKPYADPRKYLLPGGSPIKKPHATACRRAGITDFRVHDWRHHWACWCVMSGIDLETIRQEGGWKSLRMVECYAAVSAAHRSQAMRKLK